MRREVAGCREERALSFAHRYLGIARTERGDFPGAEREFLTALQHDPSDIVSSSKLGYVLGAQGREAEAIAQYEKTLLISAECPEARANLASARNNLGHVLMGEGRTGEAEEEFRKALSLDPSLAEAHSNLAEAFLRAGNTDAALAEFRKAVALKPKSGDLHYQLAVLLLSRGQRTEAIGELHAALALNPKDPQALNNLASALLQEGHPEEALPLYEKALEANPSSLSAHNNLGLLLLERGKRAEALAHFRRTVELDPSNLGYANNLAWILATGPDPSLRDPTLALSLALAVTKADGGANPSTLRTLAAAYADKGDFPKASDTARRALAIAQRQKASLPLSENLKKEITLYQGGRPLHFGE
jgi:tetratricopeptide (TPR) repeat protein